MEEDSRENLNKHPKDRTSTNLDNLVKTIRSCGVTFDVWEKMDGSDKKLLNKKLRAKTASAWRECARAQNVLDFWP